MSETKSVQSAWLYPAMRKVISFLVHTVAPTTYHGLENIPADAPYIIICNHTSFIDPVVMLHAVKKHEVSVMAKKELLKHKPLKWFFTNMHCIPVDRGNSDMAAMRASVKLLREGGVLGIFPEGTRYHKGVMEELEGGAALLAMRSGVPVVPMYITSAFGLFRRLHCYVGKPIAYDDLKEQGINAQTCRQLNERITALYAEMVASHRK